MSRRPKRSRTEQRTPTVEHIEGPRIEMGPDYYVGPKDAVIVADPPAASPGCDECSEVREELLHTTTAFHCQTCGFTQAAPAEELPVLASEVLAAVEKLASSLDAGLQAGALPLPAWWPEDASQQATLVEALDSWDLGYDEVGGIAWREQLVVVTRGGLKLHWPADRGRQISDMHKGRPHEHTGPGRQFPAGYLRRDPRRDPKE